MSKAPGRSSDSSSEQQRNRLSGRTCQPLTCHVHIPVARAGGRALLVLGPLDHIVDTEAVDALLLLAVGLACLVGVIAGRLPALELSARLGSLVLDLLVGLSLGYGVVEELQVVLGDDRGSWESGQ